MLLWRKKVNAGGLNPPLSRCRFESCQEYQFMVAVAQSKSVGL
jgi:hypothetical protein